MASLTLVKGSTMNKNAAGQRLEIKFQTAVNVPKDGFVVFSPQGGTAFPFTVQITTSDGCRLTGQTEDITCRAVKQGGGDLTVQVDKTLKAGVDTTALIYAVQTVEFNASINLASTSFLVKTCEDAACVTVYDNFNAE